MNTTPINSHVIPAGVDIFTCSNDTQPVIIKGPVDAQWLAWHDYLLTPFPKTGLCCTRSQSCNIFEFISPSLTSSLALAIISFS